MHELTTVILYSEAPQPPSFPTVSYEQDRGSTYDHSALVLSPSGVKSNDAAKEAAFNDWI